MPKTYVSLSKDDAPRDSIQVRKELEDLFVAFYESSTRSEESLDDTYWRFLEQYYTPSPTRASRASHTRVRVSNVRRLSPPGALYRGKKILEATDNDILYDLAEDVAIAITSSEFRLQERIKLRQQEVQRAKISTARDKIFGSISKLIQLSKEHATQTEQVAKHTLLEEIHEEMGIILTSKEELKSEGAEGEFNRPFDNGLTALSFYIQELVASPEAINFWVIKSLVINNAALNINDELANQLARSLLSSPRGIRDIRVRGIISELHKAGLEVFTHPISREACAMSSDARKELEKQIEQRRLEEERMRADRKALMDARTRDRRSHEESSLELEKMAALRLGYSIDGEPVQVRKISPQAARSFTFIYLDRTRPGHPHPAAGSTVLPRLDGVGAGGAGATARASATKPAKRHPFG